MSDELEEYLRGIWRDTEGSQQRHLVLRAAHTVTLTDNAPGTFEWAAPRIASHLQGGERVLDIGCGGGQYLAFLLAQAGLVSFGVGLDRHTRLRDEVWPRLQNYGNSALVQGDALKLPFGENSFSAAMANRMLNQTGDIARALAEAARVLRPSGLLFVVTADSEKRSLLREIHETEQQALGFPSSYFHSTTQPGQRLNLENGTDWLSANFSQIRLERYERQMVFAKLDEVMEHYATGLLFHRASAFDSLKFPSSNWLTLYHRVEEKLDAILKSEGKVEIREGAALFIAATASS